jgi:hypothetical protein
MAASQQPFHQVRANKASASCYQAVGHDGGSLEFVDFFPSILDMTRGIARIDDELGLLDNPWVIIHAVIRRDDYTVCPVKDLRGQRR